MRAPLCRPSISPEAARGVSAVLDSGHLVQGQQVRRLEAELSALLDRQPVAATSSGTAALHVAMMALDIGPGDRVIAPALTFPAPAHVALRLGAAVDLVDVDPDTCCLQPEAVRAALTPETRAVIVVHQLGVPADVHGLRKALAARPDVALVEDAACALGATVDGRPCGTLGRIACFSFHPRKVVTTAEGGAVTSPSPELVERARSLRSHGAFPDGFTTPGLNLRMSDVHAAIGLPQLQRLPELLAARRRVAERYREGLAGEPCVRLLPGLFRPGAVVQSVVALLSPDLSRGAIIEALRSRGVEATIASYALHHLPHLRGDDADYPHAAAWGARGVTLPCFPGMGDDLVDMVVETVKEAIHG